MCVTCEHEPHDPHKCDVWDMGGYCPCSTGQYITTDKGSKLVEKADLISATGVAFDELTTSISAPTKHFWTNLGDDYYQAFKKLLIAYSDLVHLPEISQAIGRDHVRKTPLRVIKALSELLSGYRIDPKEILVTSFTSGKYNEMITVKDIGFSSLCAHHMLPFTGKVHFAYIPAGKIVGLSKIPRLIDALSRRLQVQENLSEEIVNTFQDIVKPRGCAVRIEAHHSCMSLRGVRKEGASMRTTALRGIFTTDDSAKSEFLSSIK